MSNKNKNKRTSSAPADQSAKKKKKTNEIAPSPSKTRQTPAKQPAIMPELSSDDSSEAVETRNENLNPIANEVPKENEENKISLPAFTFEDMNKLLDNLRKAIPDNDALKYNTRLEKMDWEAVKFGDFSVDDIKALAHHALSVVRKFKTLPELIAEAQQHANKPTSKLYKANKDQHRPKHPSSSFMIFANEIRDKLRKQNPNLTIIEIGKLIGEKWRQLGDNKKEKYIKKFEESKKIYLEEMSKYNIEHNQPEKKKKEIDRPKTPLAIYLNEKLEKDDNPDLEGKSLKDKQNYYKTKYNQLSDKKKFKYIKKCLEEEEKYVNKLKDTLNTSTQVDHKSILNKAEREIVQRMNGKPDSPPINGYALYIKENLLKPEMANVDSKLRNSQLASKWKEEPKAVKDEYTNRAKSMQQQYCTALSSYVKTIPEKEAIEMYMNSNSAVFTKEILKKHIESLASKRL